jgi:hypothetical protein
MSILSSQLVTTGMADAPTNLIWLKTDDTISDVLVAGYLSKNLNTLLNQLSVYQMAVVYTIDSGTVLLQVSFANNLWSLTSADSGDFAIPTTVNQIVYATNTAGALGASGVTRMFNAGGIDAGLSGTAGTFRSYPATAANGYLEIFGTANGGARNVTVTNAAHGQTTAYTIPDVGASTGGIVVSTAAIKIKSVAGAAAAGGAAAQSFTDAFCTSSSNVIGNWNTQTNAASVLKIVPGNGSFVVTSSADAGAGTFNYIIIK